MADIDPELIADIVRQTLAAMAPPELEAPVVEVAPPVDLDVESNERAEAERRRWAEMPADELALHEAAAARTRYRDALVDVLDRGGDFGVLAPLADALDADTIKAVRAEVRATMAAAGRTDAVAAIDAGLPSRRQRIADALARIGAGKPAAGDVALIASAIVA